MTKEAEQSSPSEKSPLGSGAALTKTPVFVSQMPGVHRYRIGSIEVTAVSDGYFDLPFELIPKATLEAVNAAQRNDHLPVGPTMREGITSFVVNTGETLILIDAGARDYMAPTAGQLLANLAAAGYKPEQVDKVVLTHMHPDHIGGIMDTSGNATFPNATLHAHEADYAFWLDEGIKAQAPEEAVMWWDVAIASVKPYVDRTELFNFETDLGGGVSVFNMAGHTPGHSGIRISSGDDQLLILGDVAHSVSLQFANPDWGIAFDVDQDAAVVARKRALDMAVTDGALVAGAHFPFPSIGHVERRGNGFVFRPVGWNYAL